MTRDDGTLTCQKAWQELFNVLFNSLVIAQTTVHKAAAVVGVKGTVVPTEKTSTTPKGGGRWW